VSSFRAKAQARISSRMGKEEGRESILGNSGRAPGLVSFSEIREQELSCFAIGQNETRQTL